MANEWNAKTAETLRKWFEAKYLLLPRMWMNMMSDEQWAHSKLEINLNDVVVVAAFFH